MLVERLEEKAGLIREIFDSVKGDWEETFYLLLCRNFGFKVNAEPFLHLGRLAPLRLLLRHSNKPLQLEALLFGQAGLLPDQHEDAYISALKREYAFLRHKYQLRPMHGQSWKFLRMRPHNFPTVRIAQMAAFIQQYQHTFSRISEAGTTEDVFALFKVTAAKWWNDHYTFKQASPSVPKSMGNSSIENILINTVCPLLFFYGRQRNSETHCEKALDWYGKLTAEDNQITRAYEELSFKAAHAGHSQALIQLHANYCSKKKCLQCAIGAQALKKAPIEV